MKKIKNKERLSVMLGVLLIALSGLLYGCLGYFGVQLMNDHFSVYNMLFWRFIFAGLFMFILALFVNRKKLIITDNKFILRNLLNSILYAGGSFFYFLAIPYIGTGLAMTIFFCFPIIVIAFSFFLFKEKISQAMILSMIFVIIGLILINHSSNAQMSIKGCLYSLLAALSYALYLVLNKKQDLEHGSITTTVYLCFFTAAVFLIPSLYTKSFIMVTKAPDIFNLFALGVIATALPILLLLLGLSKVSAGKAAILSVLEPVATVIVGAIFLNEHLSKLEIIGIIFIIFGSIFVQIIESFFKKQSTHSEAFLKNKSKLCSGTKKGYKDF